MRAMDTNALQWTRLIGARPAGSSWEHKGKMTVLDVIVVGGGLSGLYVAHNLPSTTKWKLLEASSVLGGRLANDTAGDTIDMGAAWIWPDHQPHMKSLVKELGVSTFPQPGDSSSTRVVGGAVEFVKAMASRIESEHLCMSCIVTKCRLRKEEGLVEIETVDGQVFKATQVVFAVPPKLLVKSVTFDPPLSREKEEAMKRAKTWMAGVTKVALVYPKRFWDLEAANTGLPSLGGPAFQVYDSSTQDGSTTSALTFFALAETEDDSALADQVANQMAALWKQYNLPYAERALSYTSYRVQRWPLQPFISDTPKPKEIQPHPMPVKNLSSPEWARSLLFAGTETDLVSPGVMEGAIGAAKRVLKSLLLKR